MAKGIYLDNSTTTRPSTESIACMLPFLRDMWATPASPHLMGQQLINAVSDSYKIIYDFLGAKETDDFVFTSSGPEAVNQVLLSSYFNISLTTGKNQFITSHIEEAASIMAIGRLEKLECIGKMVYPNKSGKITAEILAEAISPRTAMISLSWANGLTGVIQPVAEIAKLCQLRGIALHLDATHILGKSTFDLHDIGVSFLTFNGDHLHAPKGTGGLWIKGGTACSPLILGSMEQGGFRAGNLNVAGLSSLAQAAKEALDSQDLICMEVARLRDKLEMGIVANYPDVMPFYQSQDRLPHCSAMAFPGIANEAMLYALNRQGVFACIGGGNFQKLSLILEASGIESEIAQTAISFSLSRETTEGEIERAIEIVASTAKRLAKTCKT